MMGWRQLDYMRIICTLLQTDTMPVPQHSVACNLRSNLSTEQYAVHSSLGMLQWAGGTYPPSKVFIPVGILTPI